MPTKRNGGPVALAVLNCLIALELLLLLGVLAG